MSESKIRSATPMSLHRKTCKAINEPGHAHALTFSCFRRQPFLSRDRSRTWTIEAIGRAAEIHRFHIWAYVLMPEHVHLLVCPIESEYDTSDFLRSLKKSVANKAVKYVRKHAPAFLDRMLDQQPNGADAYRFWQRARGYDRNIWEPRYVHQMIDYIHANPVRRGLCERPEDWPWSSAADYANIRQGPLVIDFDSLPSDDR